MARKLKIEDLILIASGILIFTIALLNPGAANDNHFEVSELIRNLGYFPKSDQCWQCYHPPLYHWLVAKIWIIFGIETTYFKQISAQLLNSSFGFFTLLVLKKYIYESRFDLSIKHWVFLFVAFNPRLIAISTQATNDALIILLGTLNIYFLIKLSKTVSYKNSFGLIVSLVLASMTKLNFGVLFIANFLVLVYLAYSSKNWTLSLKKGYLSTLFLIISLSSIALLFFNGYYKNLKNEGTLLKYNSPVSGLPPLYKKPNDWFPGIQTIAHGFFTFYYFDLIKNPKLTNDPMIHLKHQTSHFSQIYGRFNFLFFDDWPVEWRTKNVQINLTGSTILALGVLPLFALFLGIFLLTIDSTSVILGVKNSKESLIALLCILGFLGFSIIFSMIGKNYTFMKVIYIFPGLLAFIFAYLKGLQYIKDKLYFKNLIGGVTFILTMLNILTLFHLISILMR